MTSAALAIASGVALVAFPAYKEDHQYPADNNNRVTLTRIAADSHHAWNGIRFTAPATGIYSVNVQLWILAPDAGPPTRVVVSMPDGSLAVGTDEGLFNGGRALRFTRTWVPLEVGQELELVLWASRPVRVWYPPYYSWLEIVEVGGGP